MDLSTTPRLEKLQIEFFSQLLILSQVSRTLSTIDAAENLRFENAVLTFSNKAVGGNLGQGYIPMGGPTYAPFK